MGNYETKVLALKYRPKTFSDLIGQDIMTETIVNSIKMNKVPNAYLFSGIRGVGKTTTARIVAKSLNCKNGIENLCQDEMCEHCSDISNSNHIDVLEMDAASKTGIDDVRDLIELIKFIFEGKEEQTLEKFRDISDLGVEPKLFLNDFLEILYFIKNIKIFEKNEISFSLSDGQTEEIRKLSNQIDTETLITFWQFSIKSLEELNIVSNQNLSIEMFLIRLIHLKKIPKLEELLRNIDITQDRISSKEIGTLSNTKNEIKENIIKETNQSADQIKNIVQEKKEILNNDKASNLPNENKSPHETVLKFDSLISLCLKYKEMQLKYDLEKNVNLVKFSNGQIEFSFNENINKNFIKNLSQKLFNWTGKRWIITLSKKKNQRTTQEIELKKKKTQLEEVIKTNTYEKMLEVFPDAKLITIEESKEKK